jgi:pimeloyl-ACP methyl ester carboxylesterase
MRKAARYMPSAIILLLFSLARPAVAAVSTCEPDGLQSTGAVYRVCMPETWNGDLVLFAHGYVGFNEPVAIPEDQLVLPDGTSVPEIVNKLGYAFATTSYRTNGLAVLQGIDDLLDLVNVFNGTHGRARRVYLVGPSEGGIVTALAVERHPEVLAGFAIVVFMANRQPLTGIEAALPDAASREEYRSIVRANGALP